MKNWLYATALFVVVGIAGCAWGVKADIKAEAWAAWAQAYFSVLAIAVAIAVAQWARSEERRREVERERSLAYCKMDMVVSIAEQAITALFENRGWTATWDWEIAFAEKYSPTDVDNILAMLGDLGPADVTDGPSLKDLLILRGAVANVYDGLKKVPGWSAILRHQPAAVTLMLKLGTNRRLVLDAAARLTRTRDGFQQIP